MEDKGSFWDTSDILLFNILVSIALYFWKYNETCMHNNHFSEFILYLIKNI